MGCQRADSKEDKKADAKKEEQPKAGKQTQTEEKPAKPSAEEKAEIEKKKAEAEDVKDEARIKVLTTLRDLEGNMETWKGAGHGTLSKDDRFVIQSNIQSVQDYVFTVKKRVTELVGKDQKLEDFHQRLGVWLSQAKKGHVDSVADIIEEVEDYLE
ncbi:hypothetical protein [Bacillus thuringiensis]|uniref:hypothetical protein n=1 Tax=Bacillus thuringiensis TaxID=1428 RepID=UPI00159B9E7F|nr:hypothetical protein [Bacillus thuringiensis]